MAIEKSKLKMKTLVDSISQILLEAFLCAALFIGAGTFRFWNAWLFIGAFYIPMAGMLAFLAVRNPDLYKKRVKIGENERTQNVFKILLNALIFLTRLVAGLDFRLHWSFVPAPAVVACTAAMIGGIFMMFAVIKQNAYLSAVIEIQEGQKVMDSGLYSVVRHPMYLASIILYCFSPLVMGSYYALTPALLIPFLLVIRIVNEEKVLVKELKGYDSYRLKTRFRLIPFVW